MEQGQINEVLRHQKDFLSSIDEAIEWKLYDVQMSSDELHKKIISGLRWGLFLRKGVKNFNDLRTVVFNSQEDCDLAPLVRINLYEILAVQKILGTYGFQKCPIFSDKIDKKFLDREIQVDFCYDTLDLSIREIISNFKRADTSKLLKAFELKLTLPDAEQVFNITENSQLSDRDIYDLDIYDNWKWEMEQNYGSFLQIGGNGNWVKYNYSDNYIAQVNNEVDEGGSVYVTVSPEGDFKSFVEMY